MRASKVSLLAVGATALAVPAVGLGAGWLKPENGTFTGRTSPYVGFHAGRQTAAVTLTIRGHEIRGITLLSKRPPLDAARSHGNICGAVNEFLTRGYGQSGSMGANGSFVYTFDHDTDYRGVLAMTDTITLKGTFTDTRHVKGTFRDVIVASRKSPAGPAHCDTGTIPFTATYR